MLFCNYATVNKDTYISPIVWEDHQFMSHSSLMYSWVSVSLDGMLFFFQFCSRMRRLLVYAAGILGMQRGRNYSD